MDVRCNPLITMHIRHLQPLIFDKYEISSSDAELAIKYLAAFFDVKTHQPNKTIILPQIADWAWHELILDTRKYRLFCYQIFGRFLPHIKENLASSKRDLRAEFEHSCKFLQETYNLSVGDNSDEWKESGWGKPMYRLREPVDKVVCNPCSSFELSTLKEEHWLYRKVVTWLPLRLMQRFGLSASAAQYGVLEHITHMINLKKIGNRAEDISIFGELAWQEHILWTDHYTEDCKNLFGYFLHHHYRPNKRLQASQTIY